MKARRRGSRPVIFFQKRLENSGLQCDTVRIQNEKSRLHLDPTSKMLRARTHTHVHLYTSSSTIGLDLTPRARLAREPRILWAVGPSRVSSRHSGCPGSGVTETVVVRSAVRRLTLLLSPTLSRGKLNPHSSGTHRHAVRKPVQTSGVRTTVERDAARTHAYTLP